jgi:hypothetical protein
MGAYVKEDQNCGRATATVLIAARPWTLQVIWQSPPALPSRFSFKPVTPLRDVRPLLVTLSSPALVISVLDSKSVGVHRFLQSVKSPLLLALKEELASVTINRW